MSITHEKPKNKGKVREDSPDEALRKCGYKIHSRPKDGSVIWSREGRLYRQVGRGCVPLKPDEQNKK